MVVTQGLEEFGGGDRLPRVTLGVLGAVDEEASYGGGEMLAADGAGVVVLIRGEGENAGLCGGERGVEFVQEGVVGGVGVLFGTEGGELGGVELRALSVGEQAVERTGDVAEVEGYGWEAVRAGVEFGVGEGGAPAGDVFGGELKGVDDLALDRVEVGVGVAEPGFGDGAFGHCGMSGIEIAFTPPMAMKLRMNGAPGAA